MIRANKQQNHARRHVGLVLALVVLISAATPATGPIRPASAQEVIPSWSYTGSLNTAHPNHSATLLPNGKVLVVGGSSAELYDPSTGTWSFTGSPNVSRGGFTATLLGNGKVLVAGGDNTAELYDPVTGAWSPTGSLNAPRTFHTATLLQNGKVLVASGVDSNSYVTNTAQLYDPVTGAWSPTGSLNTERNGHTATLLQDGKVLVSGGLDGGDFSVFITELYDPATGTWSVTGTLNAARAGHTTTQLPNGDVLLVGECIDGIFCGNSSGAELYNSATGRWSYTGSLLKRRTQETVTLLPSGQVLVVGGLGSKRVLNSAELYDPATGKWNTTASLNTARYAHTATLLQNGKVLVVGGYDVTSRGDYLQSAELYDPEPPIPAPTIIMASVSGKKLYITGENFHAGAVILLNGEEQKSKNDAQNPQTTLIGKNAGKKIRPGDRVQVRNPDGTLSQEFTFTGT